jgi:hypothetical protein
MQGGGKGARAKVPRELRYDRDRLDKYWFVVMCVDGIRYRKSLHSVVLETFVGPRPVGMQIRHLDGDSRNNHVANLRYGTAKENGEDRRKHGTVARGSKNGNSKLSHDQVRMIRQLHAEKKLTRRELITVTDISVKQLNNILNELQWKVT